MNIKTLKSIKSIFGNNKGLPILDNFYIDKDYLYFSRLDLQIKIKHFFPISGDNLPLIINANNFISRISTMHAPYQITSDRGYALFTNAGTTTKMLNNYDDKNSYPINAIAPEYEKLFVLSWDEIKIMNLAKQFVADDQLRPIMQAICVSKDHIVSSDAHKLYYQKIGEKTQLDVLIDKDVISLMMLSSGSNFTIHANKDHFFADNGEMEIYWHSCQRISKNLIESGNYPNWKSVIPETTKKITIPVIELLHVLDAINFVTKTNSGYVEFTIADEALLVSAKELDFNNYASEIVNIFNPDKISDMFAFKTQFLKEILKLFRDEGRQQVSLSFNDSSHAFIFNDVVLLMPMMLNATNSHF